MSETLSEFKRELLAIIRPTKHPFYDVFDKEGIKKLTKLRVNFSPLNKHRSRHNFDCSSPTCICGRGIEDNGHFLLHCHQFDLMCRDFFRQPSIPGLDITELDLFGSKDLNLIENRIIIEATISFIA